MCVCVCVIGISRKNTTKRIKEPEKNRTTRTYNKNNPEIFKEIIKNLELKNKDKIKEILDNPKILKEYSSLLHSEKTQHNELPNAIINDAKYVI